MKIILISLLLLTLSLGAVIPTAPPVVKNDVCENMKPICFSDALEFTSEKTDIYAETGAYYGCLYSAPSPAWFYMLISDPGYLEFEMQGAADIDYHIWGPFPTITSAKDSCVTGLT